MTKPTSWRRLPATADIATRLTAALAERDPGEMLRALYELDSKHNGMDFHRRPEPLGMLGGLWALHLGVMGGGIQDFLDRQEGAAFHETEEWCRRIGAKRARAYLHAVAKLYPGGRVPADGDERFKITSSFEDDLSILDPVSPLRKLDLKYKGAVDEMAEALRAWVTAHRAEVEAALAAPAQRDESPEHWEDLAEEAIATLEKAVQRIQDEGRARQLLAEQRGIRELDGREDPRMTKFINALAGLTEKQWLTICVRHLASARKMNKARLEVGDVALELHKGNLIDKELYERAVQKLAYAARERARAVIAKLPEQTTRARKPFPFRKAALFAMNDAWQALMVHDWLVVTKEGASAAQAAYAPFAGFAPLP